MPRAHDRIIAINEACELTGLHRPQIYKRMRLGLIPYFRYIEPGFSRGAIRFRESDILAYRDKHLVPARRDDAVVVERKLRAVK